MKFTQLKIENFLAIGEASMALNDRGLMVIQGSNEDNTSAESNGAGKSTLPDALCWALYGTTARGLSGDPVVNDTAGKNCMVSVEILDGMETYRVERYRKHKTHKNSLRLIQLDTLANTEKDLSDGTDKLTQIKVEKVLGCSYEVFRSSIYAGQEQMPDLPGMTDKQLKLLVEEAAGVTVLEDAYKEANARLLAAQNALRDVNGRINTANGQVQHWAAMVQNQENSQKSFQVSRGIEIHDLGVEANTFVARFKATEHSLSLCDKAQVMADITKAQIALANLSAEKITEDAFKVQLQKIKDFHYKLTVLKQNTTAEMVKADRALKQVNQIVGQPCGECGKTYCRQDIAAREKTLSDDIARLSGDLDVRNTELADAAKTITEAQGQLSAHQSSMTDVSAQTAALSALNVALRDIERLESEKKQWGDKARAKLEEIKRRKAAPNPFDVEIVKTKDAFEKSKKAVDAIRAQIAVAEETVQRAEAVAKVFAPSGVRAHILDEVTPYLNDQTAKYLGTLTDGNAIATWTTLIKNAKGDLREKFSIEVEDKTGGSSFVAMSGGEKRKVRIAASLALQDLVATRATKPIELFVGDEIDDALDRAGLERLTAILDEKAKERGTVIVISHNDLRDWISNTVMVTKKNKVATLTENIS